MMRLLSTPVAVHNIEDAEVFVRGIIWKLRIVLRPDELDELVAEGLAQLWKLSTQFVEQKEGYDGPGKFSGYATTYLPSKILYAWHRSQEHHVQRVEKQGGGNSKRVWIYHERVESYDALVEKSEDNNGAAPFNANEEMSVRGFDHFTEPPRYRRDVASSATG